MLASRAAPPNRAPMPMAAVWTGAGLALLLADEDLLEAELVALAIWEATLLVTEASSDDRELAMEPVAVASAELREASRLDAAELMEEISDETTLLTEDRAEDRAEVAELADDMALEMLERLLESTEVTVVDWACLLLLVSRFECD